MNSHPGSGSPSYPLSNVRGHFENVLHTPVSTLFPYIQRHFVPQHLSGYDGWRLDDQVRWDTSMYLYAPATSINASVVPVLGEDFQRQVEAFVAHVHTLLEKFLVVNGFYEREQARELLVQNQGDIFVTRYVGAEGVRKHMDGTFLSVLIGLNSDFEGGELLVWDEEGEHTIRYTTGDVVITAGDVLHMGSPVTSGERWIIVVFFPDLSA